MTYIKFKPTTTRELFRDSMMPKHMAHLFDSLLDTGKQVQSFSPRTNIIETASAFNLQISLPGLKKEEIKIDVENDTLTISGERKFKQESETDKVHLVEGAYGSFSRSFNLPENIDKQGITAELVDGVLTLSIPKVEVQNNKTSIAIR